MTLHIISDNPLLLLGISEKMREELPYHANLSIKIHYPVFSEKEIHSDDMILICIYNKIIRMNILAKVARISTHIALMVDCLFEEEMASVFPMRVSRKISFPELISLRKKIRQQPFPTKICEHTYRIFEDLYKGSSIHQVVEQKQLNLVTTYSLKKRIFRRFGLKKINDKGIIHCMEYLKINRLARELRENNTSMNRKNCYK